MSAQRLILVVASMFVASVALSQETHDHATHAAQSSSEHVPPDPPQHQMPDMSPRDMIELMDMDDSAALFMIKADRLEWRRADDEDSVEWDVNAWYGNDYDKLWFKSEGESADGDVSVRNELLWDRVLSRWWNLQAGVRHDSDNGPSRTWAAIGLQGLAPYWFDVEVTAYLGEEGRTALRVAVDYEILLTQRWRLQPEIEVNAFGKDDADNLVGSGLSSAEAGLRLRYEVLRELAPYVGVVWTRRFGDTADLARAKSVDVSDTQLVAGIRWWF